MRKAQLIPGPEAISKGKMLNILTAPNPILSQKAKPVVKVDSQILKIIDNMKQALLAAKDPVGVGLAAVQIGLNLQIFISKPSLKPNIYVFINPKIKNLGRPQNISRGERHTKLEGCLSLPNVWGEVKRFPTISVSYLDETGKTRRKQFHGFMSIIIQHEVDHLHGILFPKKVLEQGGILYKSSKNENGEDEFEELEI